MIAPRPVPGAPAGYAFPRADRYEVGAGQVLAVHMPGQAFAAVRLVQPAGAVAEDVSAAGVSMLTADCLEDGSEGDSSLAPALERHGAEWAAGVGWDSFITGVDVPVNRIEAAARLLAEAVRRPALRPDDVIRRRDQMVERFTLDNSYAPTLAGRAVGGQLFEGRYAVPVSGEPGSLAALEPDAVAAFHAANVAAAAGTLVVTGDLDGVDVAELGRIVFGDAQVPAEAPGAGLREVSAPVPRVVVIDRPDSVQSAIVLAHRAPARREVRLAALRGAGEVLGGMFTSRLNLELRERRGYTYGAHARFDLRRDAGVFLAATSVDTPTTADTVSASVAEIERLREGGVTDDELEAVKQSNTVGLPVRYATAGAVASALVERIVHDLPEDHVDLLRADFEALTDEDLRWAARTYLHPDRLVAVVVGEAAAITEPLEKTGLGPVVVRDPGTLWS
ncbi:MAG: insulinase family protein [Streptosporangiales bacterium]|nr:insulinase family protein [Streptosporangiales bacterium]